MYALDRGLAAKSAARCGENVARQPGEIYPDTRRKKRVESVFGRAGALTGRELNQLAALRDDSLGKQKAGGQFVVLTRRPHCHSDVAAPHPNFQRFFSRQQIAPPAEGLARPSALHFHGDNLGTRTVWSGIGFCHSAVCDQESPGAALRNRLNEIKTIFPL